jgi:hypothetical protein
MHGKLTHQHTSNMMSTGLSLLISTCTMVRQPLNAGPRRTGLPGNGTQALVMPLNAQTYAEELAMKAGKPPSRLRGKDGKQRRGWTGFYGSVHDIVSV